MELYSKNENYTLYKGNMLDMLEVIEPNSIDVKNYYGFIYITTNLTNKKMYIGKKIFASNWRTYLGSGIGLKKAIQKYGKDNFNRIIIDLAKTKEELNKKEIFYIDKFNAISSSNFYNMAKGGIGGDTYSGKSKEEIETIKKKLGFKKEKHHMFGKHTPDEVKKKIIEKTGKKVRCVETKIIYNSTREAERITGIHHENIAHCCRNNYGSAGKLHWEYIKEEQYGTL